MEENYRFYEVNGKRYKISESQSSEFEKDFPAAKVNMAANGKKYLIDINQREEFLNDFGDGASYTNFDEQEEPKIKTDAVEQTQKPKKDSLNNILASVNDSLMRAQHGANKTFADQQAAKMTAPAPEINRDMADLVIESHRGNKTRVDEYLAEQDKTGYDYDPTKMGGSIPMPAMGLANNMYLQSKKAQKTKGQNYTDALIAQRLQGKVEDKVEQYLDPSKTFVTGAIEGIKDTAFDLDTWDSGMAAEDAARIYAISKKLDKGGELSEGEDMIIEALVDDLASDMYLAAGFGRGYKAGQVTGESLPFMVETMLNPASKFGESITKKFGKEVFKRVSRKLGAKAARAAVHGTRVLSDVAGAAMMSATTSQARVAEDALNRLRGQVDFEINEDGTLGFKGFVGGEESALKAYAKAYGANTIEHFSEMVGNYFAPMGEMAKEGTAALANKIGLKKVGELLTEMTPNGFGSLVNDFAEQTQWHGMIGEFAEEMVSGAMNALVVGDQSLRKYDKDGNLNENYLFDKENMIDTFLGVAILGGVMSTSKTLGYTTPETKYNREISRARKALEGQLTEDEIKQLEAFAANPMGAEYANLTPFFDKNRKQETKEAVAKYMSAVMEKQGYLIAREADLSGTQQGMNEMQNAWQLGRSMSETDLYDVDEAETQAKQALLETGMFDVAEGATESFLPQDVLGYSSYDLFRLSERKDWDFTDDQRQALKNLAIVKNAKEGLNNRLNSIVNAAIARESTIANESANNGVLTIGRYNDKTVFVRGNVAVSNGSIEKPADVNGYPVEIVDFQTGETSLVDSSELSSVGTISAEIWNTNRGQVISDSYNARWEQWRNTKSAKSKLAEIQNFVGEKVYIKTANNDMAEVEVQQILPNGEVLISGKKGDLGGQSTMKVDVDSFYDSISRDANGNIIFDQSGFRSQSKGIEDARNSMYVQGNKARDARKPQQNAAPTNTQPTAPEAPAVPEAPIVPEPAPEAEVVPEVPTDTDFRGQTETIFINGVPVEVEVTGQDNTADRITYEYTDENGKVRSGSSTIAGFIAARQQASPYQPEAPAAPESVPTDELPPIPEEGVPTVPDVSSTPAPVEAPAETPIPTDSINWDVLLDTDPEGYFAEMQSRFGEKAAKRIGAVIAVKQKEIDTLNKANPKTQEEIFENEDKKEALQNQIDVLNGMIARLTAAEQPVAETPSASEIPAGEAPAATVVPETPAQPTAEVPAEPVGEAPAEPETPAGEAPAQPTAEAPEPSPVPEAPTSQPTPQTTSTAKQAGGAISRMIKEARAKIDKIVAKSSLKDFLINDPVRPAYSGIYREGGYETATNGMLLARVKGTYPAEQEGKVLSPVSGAEVTNKYPKAEVVINEALTGSEINVDIDDIIAFAQALEDIKKGMRKEARLSVKVGNSIFMSDDLLKAAKFAKKHGLTTILQRDGKRAMAFTGENGTVVVMPKNMLTGSTLNIEDGKIEFNSDALYSVKTPTTIKGIETARETLEAILPNLEQSEIDSLKKNNGLKLLDGKVVFTAFDTVEILKQRDKAKDKNTYDALDSLYKNGLEIPLSTSEIARMFPKEVAAPATTEGAPVAPNPVDNPINEARKKERQLITNLAKIGLAPEAKQDLAYNAGKAVADMFPTREAYDAYAETAADFGAYNADFERGVEDSFAARNQQNTSNPPVNSVPLENEQNGEDNGEQQPTSNEPTTEGRGSDTTGGGTNDGGSETEGEGGKKTKSSRSRKSKASQPEQVEEKYPARKGNATGQLLVDTFGLDSVTIPDTQKKILNTIYDFMMEMSKTLGISPKSIGQGGWLNVRNKPTSRKAIASHELTSNTWTGEITDVSLRFKYSRLSSIAHEWWHSLDRALSYFETGKKADTATSISEGAFTGRKETWDAVQDIMKALNDSGYTDRIRNLVKGETPKTQAYFLSPTEQAARAFDEYITMRFAEAGITIENYDNHRDVTQPTAEEMKVVTPAIENLFKVLQEKEGKKPGTSVLYQIGEMMEENSDAKKLATETILQALKEAGIDVTKVTDEQVQQMLAIREELSGVEWMTVFHGTGSIFDSFDHSHMGEGEGAQAHGWGTYVAVAKKTGESYASMMGGGFRVLHNGEDYTDVAGTYRFDPYSPSAYLVSLIKSYGDVEKARVHIEDDLYDVNQYIDFYKEEIEEDKDAYEDTLRKKEKLEKALELLGWGEWTVEERKSQLYTVEIPEDDGSNYLNENGTMSEGEVERLEEACNREGVDFLEVITPEINDTRGEGKQIYSNLTKMLGSDKAASEFLSRAGFAGIKYEGRRDGECYVIFNESDAKITGRTEFYQTPNGTVYGWTDGKKIYLTNAGINPNTPVHEYTHLWAKAMMQKNPKGWNSIKQLLKNTPIWNEVMNDANYSNIHGNEDAVASEALSRISGTKNAAKLEQMAQQMIDEAKGTMRKAEARGLIQNMKDALTKFWNWVGTNLFGIENFESVEQVTDRVLYDLLNKTDLGELSEGQVETQIVTDPKVISELEASPKRTGYRNVVQNEDGTFSSPMAYWLQGTKAKGGAKSRVETAKFELGKWEEAEEHPELVDDNGHVVLVKPDKNTVEVAYDPYIHNRLDPVNLQFKAAWKRAELVYVETEVPETDLNSGYHAEGALLPVGVHSWSNGDLMLSKYDKPVRIVPWEEVADAWVERLNGEGVEFDVVPAALRPLLVERGVEILPPHNGSGKDCVDAYENWKNTENSISLQGNKTRNEQDNHIPDSPNNGTRDAASSNRGLQATSPHIPINGGIIREYKGETRRRAERANQRVRESLEKNRDLVRYYRSVYPELSSVFDLLFNDIFYRNAGSISANVNDITSYIDNTYGIVGKDLSDFLSSVAIEQLSIREEESREAFKELEISQNEIVPYDTIKKIFDSFAPMEYESLLFERLIKLAEQFDVKIFFATKQNNKPIDIDGQYDSNNNTIAMDASLLSGFSVTDRVDFVSRIVHELLHSVTSKGFALRDAYNILDKKGQASPAFKLPKNVIEALDTLEGIYDAIKDKPELYGEYGLTNKKEMIAELSNPSFREKLQDDGLWEKVKKAIAKLLSYIKGENQTSTLSAIEDAVDKLLSELETGSADFLYSLFTNNDSIHGNFVDFVQNAAVDYLAGPQRNEVIQRAVNEEAAKLNVNVTYATREQMPKGHKNDKGYYNTNTGEIVICTENAASIADAIQTILHEAVAHKGLRQLMGDKFNEFINRVYDSLDAETKAKVDALAESKYNGNTAVAMEEYMASLAETENFAENSVWDKIKSAFENIINAILGRNDIKIGDNELRYILRASYNNMVNPRNMETVRGWAQDQMMREEYEINHVAPELLSRTGIDPTQVATQSASLVYDKVVSDSFQEFQRQFQDAMQPVRIAIDAIQQETGNVPIEDYENYILIQNQSSSRSRVEIDDFARRYYSPIIEQVNKIIDTILESRGYDKNDRVKRSEVYKEVKTYLIAKHGLERNAYYQTRNTRKITAKTKAERIKSVREDHNDIVDQIKNDTTLSPSEKANLIRQEKKRRDTLINQIRSTDYELDVRDYSGLTALFATEDLLEAEKLAQEAVDKFENEVNTDELWSKINVATDKTLRHSYESGLLSRQQYNDIKAMFQFYIPLRGFDESTAEDVYAYARFEGNRFKPAVQKAEGRTSLADDPIAIIMNMAESEIAQGNKNRAKQALYNYLLNRSDGMDKQNSLMQIESVWYEKKTDRNGNEFYVIAAPDRATGETLEEFEERMQVMAEAGLAKKSQKGHVDVGMRFQKPSNKDAHYVYLKVNGVEKAIYINGNPKAADAINGTYAPMPSKTMQAVKDVQRLVSSTFTNYSLEFTARNYFRDMVYSHINIGVRESDPAYRKKFRQNWRHNNMRAMLKMLTAYRAGEYDGRTLTADEAAFVEFMNNGGQTGYTLINSVETHKKELERAIERMQNGIVKGGVKDSTIFRYTLGGIELLNEASELVTRFAAFKTSRDMGRGINRSINDAKEVTVNFNTKGAQDGTGWMGVVARYLGAVKYFFNASVQGVQNLGAAFQKNKLKFGSVVGGTIGLGMLMPVLQGALSELMGGDEDEYWNIPEYDRQNNLCFVIGKGKYIKLPLPIGFREMYGLGDLIIAGFANKKFVRNPLSVGMDVANKIATIVLPINPLEGSVNGLSLIESGQDMLLPDFLQGVVQNRTNTDFKGVPIQKEYTYNENDPQWTKAFANNPAWLTGLSKWCYEHLELYGESWDWSPEKLDNTFSNAFGGIYSLLKKTGRTVSAIWNEDNRTLSNIPLVGVIVGSNIDDDQRFVNSTYWEMDEYYNKRLYKIKSTAANFGLTLDDVFARNPEGERAGEHHPAMNKIYNKDYFDFMQEWYLGHKGEGETDENGEKILGLSQIKNKIKNLENKIKKNEGGVATPEQDEELVELNNEYEATRRDLVNDLLELD